MMLVVTISYKFGFLAGGDLGVMCTFRGKSPLLCDHKENRREHAGAYPRLCPVFNLGGGPRAKPFGQTRCSTRRTVTAIFRLLTRLRHITP